MQNQKIKVNKKTCFLLFYKLKVLIKNEKMLASLYIENVILIKKLLISFQKGMCSITGDSGAGKSVILDSINIILGDRASQSIIRHGEGKAIIVAEFNISDSKEIQNSMIESGYQTHGELIIKKIVNKDSTSRIFVNDTPSTINFVKQITSNLIEIHGQTDQLFLLKQSEHIKILDRYSNITNHLTELKQKFNDYMALDNEYSNLINLLDEKNKDIDNLKDMQDDLTEYDIKPNEETELLQQRAVFLQSKKIIDLFEKLEELTRSSNINEILNTLGKILAISGNNLNEEYLKQLEDIQNATESIAIDINTNKDNISQLSQNIRRNFQSYNLEKIEKRIDTIREIARKYRTSSISLFDFVAEIDKKINDIDDLIQQKSELYIKLEEKLQIYNTKAKETSKIRSDNAITMSQNINEILSRLDMHKADFKTEVEFNPKKISEFGSDNVVFTARLNTGTPYFPIDKIASGGEISRLMLAFKSVISKNFVDSGVVIFDEIEAGLSGNIAKKVATELQKMSKTTQVIAITHNCYIAGFANHQIKVSKTEENHQVFTNAIELNHNERITEIAKIISPDGQGESLILAEGILKNEIKNPFDN